MQLDGDAILAMAIKTVIAIADSYKARAEHAENEVRKDFTVSERVEIGKAVEEELGKRQGKRTDLANENQAGLLELPQNFAEVAGKETIEVAAGKAGFGNKETYRQAKTVVESATPELVTAVDQGKVAISTAAKLATAPVEVQRQAVGQLFVSQHPVTTIPHLSRQYASNVGKDSR